MPEQQVLSSDGTTVWFSDSGGGDGPTVVLLHGVSMTSISNFETYFGSTVDRRVGPMPGPTIASLLRDRGARVVAVDTRGHRRSGRSADPSRYRGDAHTDDVCAVLDYLSVDQVDVVGYSMGSLTAARLLREPERLRSIALCGVHHGLLRGLEPSDCLHACGECFQANGFAEHPEFKAFRAMARLDPVHDFASIGAAMIGLEGAPLDRFAHATMPVIVLNGGADNANDDAAAVAALFPDAVATVVGGADHAMACSDHAFQNALLSFLAAQWPPAQSA